MIHIIKSKIFWLIATPIGLILLISLASNQSNTSPDNKKSDLTPELYIVTKIIDGDTLEIETRERIRLIGIDTPEVGQFFYLESKEELERLVLNKKVRLEKDISETDQYDRLLRYVFIDDSFINLEMVRGGYANAFTFPPDIKYSEQFKEAETYARKLKQGLWSLKLTPTPAPTSEPIEPPSLNNTYTLPVCYHYDCNCSDFSTHAYAQWFYDNYDPINKHRLDGDNDGIACENLP